MDIHAFIAQKIKECGSQSALARKTGVSQASINRYTSGDIPSMESITKIAKAYGLPLSAFYDPTELPPDKKEPAKEGQLADGTAEGTAELIATLEESGIDPVKIAYIKWFSNLPIEEQHKVYLDKLFSLGTGKCPAEPKGG